MEAEHIIHLLTNNQWYLFYLAGIMMFAGYAKDTGLFMPVFVYIMEKVKSKKLVVLMVSTIGGILPIPGRVSVSAGLLDQIAPKQKKKRAFFGIIDYFATHHYYLWSPLEKSVIIPMAVLGLMYWDFLVIMAPALVAMFVFIFWLVIFKLSDDSINIKIREKCCKSDCKNQANNLFAYIRWDIILWLAAIIVTTNFLKEYTNEVKEFIENSGFTLLAASALGFIGAFILGSSSRFAAIVAILVTIFGVQYLLWFFVIEFIAYLLSPMHKCLYIGKSYFETPIAEYYKYIILLSSILLITAGIFTFL